MFILMQMEALAALSREMEHQEDKDDDGEVCAPLKARQKKARHVCFVTDMWCRSAMMM